MLAAIIVAGPAAGAVAWALFCMTSTFVALAQPAVGMAFPPALAGRALSAYNLVIFVGVFVVQWGIGLLVDGFQAAGLDEVAIVSRRRWPCSWPAALSVLRLVRAGEG